MWKVTTVAVLAAISMPTVSTSAPRKRLVEMVITLPNGVIARAAAPEEEGVVVKLADGTRFGFVPALLPADDSMVVISIWDVDGQPMKRLGTVTVATGRDEVRSDTSPAFGIRVVRVFKPK